MRVVGLIVEYNPFHNGHAYHIKKAKQITKADYVIAVMSGNFLQRGVPALTDKWSRTKMALANGIDIVIELPVYFSTASAEYFASASISLLNKMGIVDAVCFGSECGNINILKDIATILLNEPLSFQNDLHIFLNMGLSFPVARSLALKNHLKYSTNFEYDESTLSYILESPNNILGIEYLKALLKTKSKIEPFTITRMQSGYHDISLKTNIVSASAIRNHLENSHDIIQLKKHVPTPTFEIMTNLINNRLPIFLDDFTTLIFDRLLLTTSHHLLNYVDINDGLNDRIIKAAKNFQTYNKLVMSIKTKRFTITRIQRALMHILLRIEKEPFNMLLNNDFVRYIKILGFNNNCRPLLKKLKANANLPIISNVKKDYSRLTTPAITLLDKEIYATSLYNLIVFKKFGIQIPNDFNQKFIQY